MRLAQPHGRGPGRKEWPCFPLPKERGRITASYLIAIPENERTQAIDRWCRSVWEAWKDSRSAIAECVSRDLEISRRDGCRNIAFRQAIVPEQDREPLLG